MCQPESSFLKPWFVNATPPPPTGTIQQVGYAYAATSEIPGQVVGQVCPGDRVVLFRKIRLDESVLWFHIQLTGHGSTCSAGHVAVNRIVFVDGRLVQIDSETASPVPVVPVEPVPPSDNAPVPTPIPQPTVPMPTASIPDQPAIPTSPPQPTPVPTQVVQEGNCDPSYPTVCIPPPPPDLDCGDIPYRYFKVLPPDPHNFDGNDNDGIGCEMP